MLEELFTANILEKGLPCTKCGHEGLFCETKCIVFDDLKKAIKEFDKHMGISADLYDRVNKEVEKREERKREEFSIIAKNIQHIKRLFGILDED